MGDEPCRLAAWRMNHVLPSLVWGRPNHQTDSWKRMRKNAARMCTDGWTDDGWIGSRKEGRDSKRTATWAQPKSGWRTEVEGILELLHLSLVVQLIPRPMTTKHHYKQFVTRGVLLPQMNPTTSGRWEEDEVLSQARLARFFVQLWRKEGTKPVSCFKAAERMEGRTRQRTDFGRTIAGQRAEAPNAKWRQASRRDATSGAENTVSGILES